MDLSGKAVWVVGASSGIGAAVAREMSARGARVAVSARRADLLEQVAGGAMLVLPADVTDVASLRAAVETVTAELGPPDVVVLASGYWKRMRADDWDTGAFRRHVDVNLVGMSNAIAAVLPGMLERRSGTIAGIASVAGYRGMAGSEAYGATKAGQINLLEALRVQVARRGVRVTTICPGFVRTPMTDGNRFPMPFIVEAEDAGRAICDGIEHDRTEIVFPRRMALLMKAARLVPAGVWPRLWPAGRQPAEASRRRPARD